MREMPITKVVKIDKRGRLAIGRILRKAGIKAPVKCVVKADKKKITVEPLPKMAERGYGIFKASRPIGDVDDILKKMKPEL